MLARAALVSTLLCLCAGAAVASNGLATPDDQVVWPQWQARMTVSTTQLAPVSLFDRNPAPSSSTSVLGDYYFDAPGLRLPASMGGLRATGGLMSGLRAPITGAPADSLPYLGLGYTGLALKGGWGVTADLGLTLDNGSRAGRALFGNQGFDGALREMRLSPLLQLGVRYAF